MRGSDTTRDPCRSLRLTILQLCIFSPWVILNDAGGAFCMGAIGGGVWNFIKGGRNSPQGERFRGAMAAMRARGPVLGGNFGIWGGMFSTFDCAMKGLRKKEDPWNSIASGAITGGLLASRGGVRTAAVSAVFGGVLLALIEGVGIAISRMSAGAQPQLAPPPN
ncbi:Mitochondrial import inner membrane translocase subunit tim17 [Zancudomyces culisetae]|uniref:Mitochondrial import inner membrane translocase subunit tim17 n=1 Tax=Zancudomyces culisetae TaxID=1213189 RepID=A0A1R1PQH9_ZANCU|nr:Mitochondrial import inner membrane translocase subunit tim17 [Zancudomyces culisetae]OMH85579.1 Mitochondrial import inner membrane translocase subunit tim17 [Zancudomyces culisetae]|eukprot:OMH83217.1 Mitochondrial import inner membrane translocase subunit tim17 [Zancudomyces culisetae]